MKKRSMKIFLILSIILIIVKCNPDEDITIHPQDEDSDNFVIPTEEKAVNNSTEISHEELDDEGYTKNENEKTLNNTIIIKPQEAKINPQAQVILPVRRRDTSKSVLNLAPCGGIPKRKADTLTNMGSNIHVIWETIQPVSGGNCTVKLSPGLEKEDNFTTLSPVNIILNKNGNFPCGRVKGFEAHQFRLPVDYVCDQCTLQWTWITPEGNFYSCSDIIINGNKIDDCIAKCKNGGACFNGKCLCGENYYGDFCEYDRTESSSFGWVFVVLILLIAAGGAVYYFFFLQNGKSLMNPFKRPQPEKPFIESKRDALQLSS